MVSTLTTLLLVLLFFFLGHITQAIKKLLGLITKLSLTILNFFGIKISKKQKSIKTSQEFKDTYKEIKRVRLSKSNMKLKSSIDWVNLSLLIIVGLLIVINMGGNVISNWLYTIQPITFIKTPIDMNTFYTATLFSALSFSGTKLLARWKETKQQRQELKEAKLKVKAIDLMSSKELLDEARKKDIENFNKLKK